MTKCHLLAKLISPYAHVRPQSDHSMSCEYIHRVIANKLTRQLYLLIGNYLYSGLKIWPAVPKVDYIGMQKGHTAGHLVYIVLRSRPLQNLISRHFHAFSILNMQEGSYPIEPDSTKCQLTQIN